MFLPGLLQTTVIERVHPCIVCMGKGDIMKRLKGQVVYAALWLTGILSFVLASGAPNKWHP
jgi:hypothetical protein